MVATWFGWPDCALTAPPSAKASAATTIAAGRRPSTRRVKSAIPTAPIQTCSTTVVASPAAGASGSSSRLKT